MALNILIVDDSSLTRKAIKRIIDMVDLDVGQVYEAENGLQGLERIEQNDVNLVLADLNMPEMGGIEMIQKMKEDESKKTIPVLIISTEASKTRIEELFAQGVQNYLHKPFTPEEFKEIIINTLGVVS